MSDEPRGRWDFLLDPDPRLKRLIWVLIATYAVFVFLRWLGWIR